MRKFWLVCLALGVVLGSCTLHTPTTLRIQVSVPAREPVTSRSVSASSLSCVFVMIAPPDAQTGCRSQGMTSPPVWRNATETSVSMQAPIADKVTIEVLGFADISSPADCHGPLLDLMAKHSLYEYGRTSATLRSGATIDVLPATGPLTELTQNCAGSAGPFHFVPNIARLQAAQTISYKLIQDTPVGPVDISSQVTWSLVNAPSGVSNGGGTVTTAATSNGTFQMKAVTPDGKEADLNLHVGPLSIYVADSLNHYIQSYVSGSFTLLKDVSPATPVSAAVGPDGLLYFADNVQNCIAKTDGATVSIAAGNCASISQYDALDQGDSLGGPTILKMYLPRAITFDKNGLMYVSDNGNDRIIQIDLVNHHWQRIAGLNGACGSGSTGSDGSDPLLAGVCSPFGLAFDGQGNLNFAEAGGHVVRKLMNGKIYRVAGAMNIPSPLNAPHGIAFDSDANNSLYIANYGNGTISRYALGSTTLFAGGGSCGTDGSAANTDLGTVTELRIDALHNLYALTFTHGLLFKIALGTTPTVTALVDAVSCPGNPFGAPFTSPMGLAIFF